MAVDTFSALPRNPKFPGSVFVLPKISPSLDPAVIQAPPGDALLNQCSDALAFARKSAQACLGAARAVFADESQTVAARHVKVKQTSFDICREGLRVVQNAITKLQGAISALDGELKGPAVPFGSTQPAELRAALSRLPQPERRKTVLAAIKSGDDSVAGAVLNSHWMTSGLTSDEQELVRGSWAQARKPDEIRRRTELEKTKIHVERAGKLLLNLSLQCHNEQIVAQAQRSAEAARLAIAQGMAG
jgi:hypothetical protein